MIGLQPAHLSNYLSGVKPMSFDTLSKILSGIEYEWQITITLQPRTGQSVSDVDFVPLEETLSSEDQALYTTDHQ